MKNILVNTQTKIVVTKAIETWSKSIATKPLRHKFGFFNQYFILFLCALVISWRVIGFSSKSLWRKYRIFIRFIHSFFLCFDNFTATSEFSPKFIVFLLTFFFSILPAQPSQDNCGTIAREGLRSLYAFEMLKELTAIGPRLSGSSGSAAAIAWAEAKMKKLGFDSVWTEPVMVPHWVRGSTESAQIILKNRKPVLLAISALGGSVPTPKDGITGEVIEVFSLEEARNLGPAAKGKIIFFNRPMDQTKYSPFEAYGRAVDQRAGGAAAAAMSGAAAVLVRSMTMLGDNVPHTGMLSYNDTIPKIPAAALSILAAEELSRRLKQEKNLSVRMNFDCQTLPDIQSANVIGEWRGAEFPNEVIVMGGHFDSWDVGSGAHDDGAGCMQSIEAVRLIKAMGIRPNRTVRAVLFINEENGLKGGTAYASHPSRTKENHIAAIEADMGGDSPRGFGVNADSLAFIKISRFQKFLEPFGIDRIRNGGGGGDIGPLKSQAKALIGLLADPHRYFDFHHSANDTIDKIHPRVLELGAIAMAILSYCIAETGL